MRLVDRVIALREAGKVERCHTLPHYTSYSVAQHSYDALSLLLLLYPGEPSVGLIKHVLWHDAPERWLGDIPGPAKGENAGLNGEYLLAEDRLIAILVQTNPDLRADEQRWVHAVDAIEFYLWAEDQVALGNQNAKAPRDKARAFLTRADVQKWLPKECSEFLANYVWKRLSDFPSDVQG